jgi:hypothetical protein
LRLKTKWHNTSGKTLQEMGSALAFSCFRLTKNQLEDLINEKFQVERAELFGIIANYLVFLIGVIDRLSFNKLKSEQRKELLTAVVKQLAFYYAENKNEVYKSNDTTPQDFVNLYNHKSQEYINCTTVDYNFYKVFAHNISLVAKDADKYWINQQIIEIQAPDSYEEINKAFNNIVKVEQIISKTAKTQNRTQKAKRSQRQKTFSEY